MGTTPSWTAGRGGFDDSLDRRFAHRTSIRREKPPAEQPSGMPWSWRIGRFAGIDIYMHATFLILIAWLLMIHITRGSSPLQTIVGIAFVLTLFACVVLHEFGHALTARRFGIATRDITLLPIGGIARLERIPRVPWQELVVALAGPAVNVVIAAVLFGILYLTDTPVWSSGGGLVGTGTPLVDLMQLNIWLAVFNLLPAFPMDGGRVLRAVLAMKIPRVKATRVASILGQMMAVLFAVVGIMGQPFLLFIALFVYLGAVQEYQTIRWEAAVEGVRARDAMVTNFRTLSANDPLIRAVENLLQSTQHDFPVLDEQYRVVGILLRQDLIEALSRDGGSQLPVGSVMREIKGSAAPDEALVNVYERMQSAQLPVLPVFSPDGHLEGLLTMENVAEVVMVRNALEKAEAEHTRKVERQ